MAAELLFALVVVSGFIIGLIFGRVLDTDRKRMQEELDDKDEQLAQTLKNYRSDLERLVGTTIKLTPTQVGRGFSWDSKLDTEAKTASVEDVRSWCKEKLDLDEGSDLLVDQQLSTGSNVELIRQHMGYFWAIKIIPTDETQKFQQELSELLQDSSLPVETASGATNIGHMIIVANPAVATKENLPPSLAEHQNLFTVVHDSSGFLAADWAIRSMALRLSTLADTNKVDPHLIELHANEVIHQGQSQILQGQQLVNLGESIRRSLIGTIPLGVVETEQVATTATVVETGKAPTTVRMKQPLPKYNPITQNPSPVSQEPNSIFPAYVRDELADDPYVMEELQDINDPAGVFLDNLDHLDHASRDLGRRGGSFSTMLYLDSINPTTADDWAHKVESEGFDAETVSTQLDQTKSAERY